MVAAVSSISTATCTANSQVVPCTGFFAPIVALFVILAPIFAFICLIAVAAGVLMIVSWWKVFEKAGRPGWPAIVPIYNLVVMFELVGISPWLILLVLIPGLGSLALFIVMIFMNIKLAQAFGKSEGFAVGLILLPIVFVPILAFGSSRFTAVSANIVNPPPQPPAQNPSL